MTLVPSRLIRGRYSLLLLQPHSSFHITLLLNICLWAILSQRQPALILISFLRDIVILTILTLREYSTEARTRYVES